MLTHSSNHHQHNAMSIPTFDKLISELRQAYTAVLLQIVHDLEKDQQEELRFYYSRLIRGETSGTLNILRSLENAGVISWMDMCSLKDSLRIVGRLDLVDTLTAFEIKRDLAILLALYAGKRQGSEMCSHLSSVELLAEYLVKITTDTRFDKQSLTSLMESGKSVTKVLKNFEEEIDRRLSDPWSQLTLLVVIAGEVIAEALTNIEHCHEDRGRPETSKSCLNAADKLCSRMKELGSWVS